MPWVWYLAVPQAWKIIVTEDRDDFRHTSTSNDDDQ